MNLALVFIQEYKYLIKNFCEYPIHLPTKPFLAPTFSQAFRWFREKYHIIGYPIFKGGKTKETSWYDYIIYSEIDWENNNPNKQWKTYEEAELESLKKLIEIVKNK